VVVCEVVGVGVTVKRNTAVTVVVLVVTLGLLYGFVVATPTAATVQDGSDADPEIQFIPNHSTALQNESVSLTAQVRNRENSEQFVLVRVFEPHGVSGMRVDGEAPWISHNNTDMWQTSETLGPRQRLAIPITVESGSDAGTHSIPVQVKYFNEQNNYTGDWTTGTLVVGQCSATCVARGSVKAMMSFVVEYRNALIAVLSLLVAILSLLLASERTS